MIKKNRNKLKKPNDFTAINAINHTNMNAH